MTNVRVTNSTRGVDLATTASLAETRWTRLRGLLARPQLRRGEGLVISPCRGVHTYGMRYPIDVVLVDGDGLVTAVYPDLEPGRQTGFHRRAQRALEFSEGTIIATGTCPGDRIEIRRCGSDDGSERRVQ